MNLWNSLIKQTKVCDWYESDSDVK